jgi:hypothetical protein
LEQLPFALQEFRDAHAEEVRCGGPGECKRCKRNSTVCENVRDRKVNGIFVYDNSCNHDCFADDALRADQMNIGFGGLGAITQKDADNKVVSRKVVKMRVSNFAFQDGSYQSMHLGAGDKLVAKIKMGAEMGDQKKAAKSYETGYIIQDSDIDIIGALKGRRQVLFERNVAWDKGECKKQAYVTKMNKREKELHAALLKEGDAAADEAAAAAVTAVATTTTATTTTTTTTITTITTAAAAAAAADDDAAANAAADDDDAANAAAAADAAANAAAAAAVKRLMDTNANEEQKKFHAKVLKELREFPDTINMRKIRDDIECHCSICTLASQFDFIAQKSGVVEVFEKWNEVNNTDYQCIFLPKFHPELNFIERCWSL